MNREKQIEILTQAKTRLSGNVAAWIKGDERVKASLVRNHIALKERVLGQSVKKACG